MLVQHYSKMKDVFRDGGGGGREKDGDGREQSREAGQGNSDVELSEKNF